MSFPQSHPKHCQDDLVYRGVVCKPPEDMPADPINHPPHYTHGVIEPIDVIESWNLGFCLGNVLKYICRVGHKGERLENLRKAQWFLNREIEREMKLRE